ncbi:FHA domain-containing protein DDL [Sphaceloma murrayae]|uniref:FHA domain-containing protein DDL n=1 Tax=Sphaceloma murrayae TaxID=2082308 RepID=A0A2K1QQG8_9PEZI|nr:FHA domain-containing protein DDL [Sphaceloma murrayae]
MGRSGEEGDRWRRRSDSPASDRAATKRNSYREDEDSRRCTRNDYPENQDRERKRRRYSSDDEDRPRRRRDDGRAERRPERRDRSLDREKQPDRDDRRSNTSSRPLDSRDQRDNPYRNRDRPRSRSPGRDRRRKHSPSPSPPRRNRGPLPSQDASFAVTNGEEPPIEKQKPNYEPTGLLAKEANTVRTDTKSSRQIILKYHEPPEARKPPAKQQWRLYHFTADSKEPADTVPLFERSCWLFGRETTIVDVRLDERTASKQHAVIQFRYSMKRDEYGDKIERVRPYLIDLESKAGTSLNGAKVEEGRYVELRDGDVLVFGQPDEPGEEWVVMLPPED